LTLRVILFFSGPITGTPGHSGPGLGSGRQLESSGRLPPPRSP
jgi:hypothetical protein